MREEQWILSQQRHAPGVGGHPTPGSRTEVEQHPPVELGPTRVGSNDPGEQTQERRLTGAVRPENRHALGCPQPEVDLEVPVAHGRAHPEAHGWLRAVCARPTTRIATATRTSDRATAASGSLSRCR